MYMKHISFFDYWTDASLKKCLLETGNFEGKELILLAMGKRKLAKGISVVIMIIVIVIVV